MHCTKNLQNYSGKPDIKSHKTEIVLNMKRILIILIALIIIAGCTDKKSFTITGKINNSTKSQIYLNRVNINTPVFIDSSRIKKDGQFRFKVKAGGPDFYQLGFSESEFITLLAGPGEKIKISFPGENIVSYYTLTGSKGSEDVRMLDLRLNDTKRKLDSLRTLYEIASKEPGFEEKGAMLETEFANIIKDIRKKNIEYIITNLGSLASIKALYQKIDDDTYVLYDSKDLQYLKITADTLLRYYPGSPHVLALEQDLKKELNQLYTRQFQNIADTIPETKLDPDLKDINGRRIALSSLRGKYVLVTFWSVESRECVAENLQFKEFYKMYNRKGFEIYQINLDVNEERWKAAVKFDELPWISTREDDPANPMNAALFNVRALPANYLFDKNGAIIGVNLHGRPLQIKLNQLFNN